MSGIKPSNLLSESSGKFSSDEKIGFYESSRQDSGFLSGEIVSGDLTEDEGPSCPVSGSSFKEEDRFEENSSVMRLDSGVVDSLSEDLSSLSLKQSNFNNLNSPKAAEKVGPPTPVVQITPTNVKQRTDCSWMKFYEQDEDGDTYLHYAIVNSHTQLTLALIRLAPIPRLLDTPNDEALCPIHLAAAMGQSPVVRWLVVAGARPDPRDARGDSPLHVAARRGDLHTCRALLQPVTKAEIGDVGVESRDFRRCDIDQWNYEGQTCVHVAALNGHIDVLRLLVSHGANINAREGQGGYTALHYAVMTRNERLAQFLLTECNQLNPTVLTYGGRSVLDISNNVSNTLVEVLLARGVPSPYPSDDEIESSDEEYELPIISSQIRVA